MHKQTFGAAVPSVFLTRMLAMAWLLGLGGAAAARADIVFYKGAGFVQPQENILFNAPSLLGTGTKVEGITNQTGVIGTFVSNETMTTPAQGQARIEGTDGSLQSLTFSLENNTAFTDFEFNVRIPNNSNPNPTFTMTVTDAQGGVHVSQAYTLGNGQNFFAVSAGNGMAIREITLTANSDVVAQFQQFRLSVLAVPEPSTLVVLGLVATLCTFRRRRGR